jgi:hypothetical protein
MPHFLSWLRPLSRGNRKPIRCLSSNRLRLEPLEDRLVLSASRGEIGTAFSHSTEYIQNFISNAYEQFLSRGPDAAGLAAWTNAMQNYGLTDERLEARFVGSPEYINNHGGAGAGWVTGMYQNLLKRTPSRAEIALWVNGLNAGVSTEAVAYGFAASVERESNRVVADYQSFLGRRPSPAEVSIWVTGFTQGVTNEAVVAGFLASAEHYSNHLNSPAAWLTAAYKDILNRAPDSAGYGSWYFQLTGQQPSQTGYSGGPSVDQRLLAAADSSNALTNVSQLAAATDGAGTVHEFALDADQRLWIRSGSSWIPDTNNIYSISTVTNALGNVNLFAVDGNDTAWFRIVYQSGNLSNWYQLFPDSVSVASLTGVTDANGSLEFFVTDTNNHLFLRTVDQYNNWSGWDNLNGQVSSTTAVLDSAGFVELFAIGSITHHVFHRFENSAGTWGAWGDLTQYVATTYNTIPVTAYSIAAVKNPSGSVELFAAGQAGPTETQNIFQAFETGANQWGAWWDLNINNKSAAIAATQSGSKPVELFSVGAISHNAFVNTETRYANDPKGAIYGIWSGWTNQTTGVANATISDYSKLAQQVTSPHQGPTIIYLNFDGGAISYQDVDKRMVTQPMQAFVGHSNMDRNQEIQTIINDVAQIYAPFNVQVQQISGVGKYSTSNGNTTIFVGDDSNDVDKNGRKYNSSFTPSIFCDSPGATKDYNHKPNSDAYDLAFVDPRYQQQAGGTMLIEDDSQIADGIAHEAGHTFGLMHVLTGDGSGTRSNQNPLDIMSYDAPNQRFLNQAFPLTDYNYDPVKGAIYHGGDHFYPQWKNNGTIETMATQNSYAYLLAVLGAHP